MDYLKQKINDDYNKGGEDEELFFDVMFKLGGFNLKKSSREEDAKEGWDFHITDISYNEKYPDLIDKRIDVKGIKGGEYNTIEITAYNSKRVPKLGWSLRGRADYLALRRTEEFGNDFVLIKKIDIRNFLFEKIPLLKKHYDEIWNIVDWNEDDALINFEKMLCNKIQSQSGEYNRVDSINEALYDKVYQRNSDMMTRITNDDLEKLATYKIEIIT